MWYDGGQLFSHSTFVLAISGTWTFRFDENASHTINVSRTTDTMETNDPIEEIIFQKAYASG